MSGPTRAIGLSREERMEAMLATLEEGIATILTSEGYREYLRVMSQFHGYSFNNVMLIWTSVPCQSAHVATTFPRISTAPSLSGFKPAMCSTCAFFS